MLRTITLGLVGSLVFTLGSQTWAQDDKVNDLEKRLEAIEKELQDLKTLKLNDPNTFRVYWKDGIRLDSSSGDFKLKIGGRIQNDWAWYHLSDDLEDEVGKVDDGTEFRRARLAISGTVYKVFEYKAQYDFAGGDADFKDVYMGLKKIPVVGAVRVGHFKEPMGLEELTSSNDITFMERSLTAPFTPSRNTGVMLHRRVADDMLLWQAGFFRETDNFGDGQDDGNYVGTGRLAALPWYEDDGTGLLHVGAAYSYRNVQEDERRFRERPESHLSSRLVDTGTFDADNEHRLGGEAAVVLGPFSVQGEFLYSHVNVPGSDDPGFHAWYAMASYFLTGESRPYKKSSGVFTRVKPKQNFMDGNGGMGAWEVAARLSRIDLDDEDIQGGELTDLTVGLNWYLNPNFRMMLNYVYSNLASFDDASIVQTRFQIAW